MTCYGIGAVLGVVATTLMIGGSDPELVITPVSKRVFSAIGATDAPSYENWGHNNNLSFVIGSRGVLVVNGGDNFKLAEALHKEIEKRTSIPVRWVVNENGQGHAFLGNSYWVTQGVEIIAHDDAIHEIEERGAQILANMLQRNLERGDGTRVVVPTRGFKDSLTIDIGDQTVLLKWFGEAHSPGDISVWLPDDSLLIAGDIAFHERLLGVFPDTNVLEWIESFDRMRALAPALIIPGHGRPTTMSEVTTYTYDYLQYLVDQSKRILDNDGDLSDAYQIDQRAYQHLNTFDELAVKNAGRVFQQLELEYF